MARATRSSGSAAIEKQLEKPSQPQSKKRKRVSAATDSEDHPQKQLRTTSHLSPGSSSTIKDEPTDNSSQVQSSSFQLPLAADSPIQNQDAAKILDILEIADSQGLLDRVFPLQQHTATSTLHSLRQLLSDAQHHTLSALRTGVHHLLPVTSQPRAKLSQPASQQLAFCNLALSLLDQASFHNVSIPADIESIISADPSSPTPSSSALPPSRYALVQRLPSGEYWSSLSHGPSASDLKSLPSGHAELVSVLPTPSTALSSKTVPTLGSYSVAKRPSSKKPLPAQRRVTTGAFLDYGVYSSFAPSFDQEAQVVGRRELGEVIYGWEQRKREKETRRRERVEGTGSISEIQEIEMNDPGGDAVVDAEAERAEILEGLEQFLPPEDVKSIRSIMHNLDLENAVQELLDRNRKALERLEELQTLRLSKEGGGSSKPEEGSEEWDTAQGIMDSLTVLASLRPRSSNDTSKGPNNIIPPASLLRKLHRTLALETSPGWYGTLPATRTTALRDDATIKPRAGAAASVAAVPAASSAVAAPPTPAATVSSTPTPTALAAGTSTASPYTGYTYAYNAAQQQPYRAQNTPYTPYKPGQAPSYYQPGAQAYYGQQAYGASASGQQPYANYSSWYANFGNNAAAIAAASVAAAGTNSGRGTPQPNGTTTVPGTYGSFFNSVAGTATPPPATPVAMRATPAVANTVMGKPGMAPGAYGVTPAAAYGQQPQAPTLPAHLRAPQQAQPQTPQPAGTYYGAYQHPTTPAAR